MTRTAITATAFLALATPGFAQSADTAATPPAPIVTSAPATPPPTSISAASPKESTASQIAAWIGDDTDTEGRTVQGVVSAMPRRDRAMHGEVGASIGSGGYRSAYGVVNMPIGEHSDLTVAIADEHLGGGNRGRGYGYGGGYRYRGGGDRQSLGIALNLNGLGRESPSIDCDREAPPKWSLGLPDDASVSNRCRRLQQAEMSASSR